MMIPELTGHFRPARPPRMMRSAKSRRQGGAKGFAIRGLGAAMLMASLGACINVSAPDEPIVIELNINIRQEVIYRLAEDAANTIDENAEIF